MIEETDEVDGYPQPESGNAFVVVRLAVKNTTDDTFIDFNGFLDTQLQTGRVRPTSASSH